MAKNFAFDRRYGVEEYYLWVSPRVGVRFELSESGLQLYRPDGDRFLTTLELEERAQQAEKRARQAEAQLQRERQRSQVRIERLREMGIDPDQR